MFAYILIAALLVALSTLCVYLGWVALTLDSAATRQGTLESLALIRRTYPSPVEEFRLWRAREMAFRAAKYHNDNSVGR